MTDSFIQIHSLIYSTDRIWIALFSIILVSFFGFVFGPLSGRALPFFWQFMHVLFTNLGKKLYKTERPISDLIFRGTLLTLFAVVISLGCGYLARALSMMFPFWGMTEALLLSCLLASGSVWHIFIHLYEALKDKESGTGGYYSIAVSSNADLNSTDQYGISRTAIGFVVRSFEKAIVAPVFWYVIGGLPVAFAYAGLAYLSWEIGKDGHSKGFGRVVNIFERILGFIPHLLTTIFIALASLFTPTAWFTKALGSLFMKVGRSPYAEGGLPLSCVAFALEISLGGPVQDLSGSTLKRVWVGPKDASAQLDTVYIKRCLYLIAVAHLLFFVALLSSLLLV